MRAKKSLDTGRWVSMYTLFRTEDCLGWAERIPGTSKYRWHNANDMGLLAEVDEMIGFRVKIVGKIPVVPDGVLYIIDSGPRCRPVPEGDELTIPEICVYIKGCYRVPLTEEEQKIYDKL